MAYLTKCSRNVARHLTLQLPTCTSHVAFPREPFLRNLRASRETALIFISCLILHQLNTKPNTIESHKIQRNNLMQLQHSLSLKKSNIKHSCKPQLYNILFVLSLMWHLRIFQFSLHKNAPLDRTSCFLTLGLCFYIILMIGYQIRRSL